jgi:hypothetical protein
VTELSAFFSILFHHNFIYWYSYYPLYNYLLDYGAPTEQKLQVCNRMGCSSSSDAVNGGTVTEYVGSPQPQTQESLEQEYQRQMHEDQLNLAASVKPLLQKTDSMMYDKTMSADMHAANEFSNKANKKQREEKKLAAAMQESAVDKSWVVSCVRSQICVLKI